MIEIPNPEMFLAGMATGVVVELIMWMVAAAISDRCERKRERREAVDAMLADFKRREIEERLEAEEAERERMRCRKAEYVRERQEKYIRGDGEEKE